MGVSLVHNLVPSHYHSLQQVDPSSVYEACLVDECNDPPRADDPDANRCSLFEDYIEKVITVLNKKNIEGVDLMWRRPARCNKGKGNKYTTPHNIIKHSLLPYMSLNK